MYMKEKTLQFKRFAMDANRPLSETDLIDRAVAWFGERLPERWKVERSTTPDSPGSGAPSSRDAVIEIRSPNRTIGTLAVEARSSLEPRDVAQLLPGLMQTVRSLAGSVEILVVAPWLSARTRERLSDQGINYIDLTGNALVSLSSPGIFISSDGAARNPQPESRGRALVRGPKAARLIRLLADVRPPYGVSELALAAQLTPGYVSRLLDALDREALVGRSRRGVVESVDFPGLLRRWSESYDVLETNRASTFLATNGTGEPLERLAPLTSTGERLLITGSFAAVRLAPRGSTGVAVRLLRGSGGARERARSASSRRGRERRVAHTFRSGGLGAKHAGRRPSLCLPIPGDGGLPHRHRADAGGGRSRPGVDAGKRDDLEMGFARAPS